MGTTEAATGDETRIALVIGNAAYPTAPLRNPVNDARAMAVKLKALGFEVILKENADNRGIARAIVAFGEKIAQGGVGLFYYSGHGMQVRGRNFLIPVDARIESEAAASAEAIDLDMVLEQMAAAGNRLNVVILDACRNNPFERKFRGTSGGLAQTDAPTGTIVAYATAPGRVASDGEGDNGLYTSELLAALDQPGLKVEDVFKRTRAQVAAATGDAQVPWESSSLVGDFYFTPPAETATAPAAAGPSATETALWNGVKDSEKAGDYQAYLKAYPDGVFSTVAQSRIAELASAPAKSTTTQPAQAVTPAPAPSAVNAGPDAAETALWNGVKDSQEAGDYQAYLETYPDGVFASLARSRIAKLASAPAKSATPEPTQTASLGTAATDPAETERIKNHISSHLEQVEDDLFRFLADSGRLQPRFISIADLSVSVNDTEERLSIGGTFTACPGPRSQCMIFFGGRKRYRIEIGVELAADALRFTDLIKLEMDR
jgi:hypothetical protein